MLPVGCSSSWIYLTQQAIVNERRSDVLTVQPGFLRLQKSRKRRNIGRFSADLEPKAGSIHVRRTRAIDVASLAVLRCLKNTPYMFLQVGRWAVKCRDLNRFWLAWFEDNWSIRSGMLICLYRLRHCCKVFGLWSVDVLRETALCWLGLEIEFKCAHTVSTPVYRGETVTVLAVEKKRSRRLGQQLSTFSQWSEPVKWARSRQLLACSMPCQKWQTCLCFRDTVSC